MGSRFRTREPSEVSSGDWGMALLSALLLALSFPIPGWWPLSWFAFVPLLTATVGKRPGAAFRISFVSALAAYSGILYWLNIVMTRYGHLPLAVSFALSVILSAYLALYPALAVVLMRRLEERGITPLLSFPLLWVALEYVRSFFLTGFPWASLGYSQYGVLPLIQVSDITGIYGVSALLAFSNVVLYRLLRSAFGKRDPLPLKSLILLLLLTGSVLGYGYQRLRQPEQGKPLRVALLQGNVDQGVKWNPRFRDETMATYERLTRRSCAERIDLAVWPESAVPFFYQDEREQAERVEKLARETGACILFGSPAYEIGGGRPSYLNSAFLLSPSGTMIGRSDKIHLVPFGEYVPLARYLPFVNKLVEGIGDFAPGARIATLDTGKGKVGVLVCFEGIFPELARGYARAGSELLVNITNDAWYGRSSAPYQHLSMIVFRAVETRLPVVRAANTGISAFIDSRGRITRQSGLFEEAAVTGEVRLGAASPTVYTRYGDVFAWACAAGSIVLLTLPRRRRT